MITFNFKPKTKINTAKPRAKKESTIITKNVIGVIHIRVDGSYYMKYEELSYNLTKESFDCKNREVLYYKNILEGNRLRIIKLQKYDKTSLNAYLPFAPGVIVKGNLVKVNQDIEFDLKETINFDENFKDESKKAFIYYRDIVYPELQRQTDVSESNEQEGNS